MALSGGKGNSEKQTQTSSSTTAIDTTTNTVDNRAVQGDNATVGGNVTVNSGEASQVQITTTDLGAVSKGLDLALESIYGIQQATSNSTEALKSVTSDSISQAYGLANQARQSETSAGLNNFLKYGAIIAVIGIIAYVLVKSKR